MMPHRTTSISPHRARPVTERISDRGATAVEYAIIAALIAAVIAGTVLLVGQDVLGNFGLVQDTF